MLYNVKEFEVQVQNLEFDCICFGRGQKSLVMIQGLNTNGIKGAGLSLALMYRIFAKEYTIYLFDRRKNVSKGFTIEEMASDIALVMDTLKIKNADVLGVSQGGMIAQYLALHRADLVRKLVLALTASRNNEVMVQTVTNWIKMTKEKNFKNLVNDMTEKMYTDAYIRKYRLFLPLLTIFQTPKDVERFMILAEACLTCNTYEHLNKIQCPVLVIGAAKDKVVTGEASIEIAKQLGCEYYLYEDLGHAAYEEANDFNQRVLDFLIHS
ncbi:MAG: alpha/beta hydrolase [Erysipelotrichaceae bacterium]|nr:alpha/beta hydrolase [Erysipelotrichaceae bacterium]